MKICENCGSEHDGKIGSGRFCSLTCARGFSTKAKRKEINEKVSKKTTGTKRPMTDKHLAAIKRIGESNGPKISAALKKFYENNVEARNRVSEFSKNRVWTKESRDKISKSASERVKNGDLFLQSKKCVFEFNGSQIKCDSKLEYKILAKIIKKFEVKEITRSGITIEYIMSENVHRFNPDFRIILHDDTVLIVECKTAISKNKTDWSNRPHYRNSIEPKKLSLIEYCNQNSTKAVWTSGEKIEFIN